MFRNKMNSQYDEIKWRMYSLHFVCSMHLVYQPHIKYKFFCEHNFCDSDVINNESQ